MASYKGSGRDIESHYYFPWQDTRWKRKAIGVTKFAKPPRVATSISDMKDAIKEEIPEGWTLHNWWEKYRTEEHRPIVKWRGTKIELRSDFRFEFPAKLRKEYNVKAGDTRYPQFPMPRNSEKVIKKAKKVLQDWLENNKYMIPPLAKGDWREEETEGNNKIGAELERERTGKFGDDDFALRVYDYDYQRVPIYSDFKYTPLWFTEYGKISKTRGLANKNTVSSLRQRGRKGRGTEEGQETLGE